MAKNQVPMAKYGDQNSVFFHKIVQSRITFNAIRSLVLITGETITDPKQIKEAAAAHYGLFLKANQSDNDPPSFPAVLLDFRCPDYTAEPLVHSISEEEIRNVIFSMPSNKASAPDGFPV